MTRGLESVITRYMYNHEGCRTSISPEDDDEHQFSMFFTIDVSNPSKIECPVFMIGHLVKTIQQAARCNQHLTKIVVPVEVVRDSGKNYKTIDSLLKDMFSMGPLTLLHTSFKNNIVYGNRGVIINEMYQLLYCETLLLDYSNNLKLIEENVYIHPDVYTDSKNIINKGIISRFMPFYIGCNRHVDFGLFDYDMPTDSQVPSPLPSTVIFKRLPILKTSMIRPNDNPQEILQRRIQTLQNSIDYAV